jgi:pantothenate kinase-related protein Tda10
LTGLSEAVEQILAAQQKTKKPLAIVLAGHNGSGKSTMWRKRLSGQLQIPLINVEPKGCPQSLGIGGLYV